MSAPYVGEIRAFGFNFAPLNWFACNGQTLDISTYSTLYAIIGTTYGGNGTTTFLLPNLQGAVPMHWGTGPGGFNTVIGQTQGSAFVTLTTAQMPLHQHTATAVVAGAQGQRTATPGPNSWLSSGAPGEMWHATPTINAPFSPSAVGPQGGSQPHDNMQPYLTINFCICAFGIFPPHG